MGKLRSKATKRKDARDHARRSEIRSMSTREEVCNISTRKMVMTRPGNRCCDDWTCLLAVQLVLPAALVCCAMAFPVLKFVTHTQPYTEWSNAAVFTPLIIAVALQAACAAAACSWLFALIPR